MNIPDRPMFSEVIKVRDSVFHALPVHMARMERTARCFFGCPAPSLHLSPDLIPPALRSGLVKCRVVYSERALELVEFSSYSFKSVESIALVRADTIIYSHKSTDRRALNELVSRTSADEIIIVRNGTITDSSFTNLVFQDDTGLYTPSDCLLPGIKREILLGQGRIRAREIRVEDLWHYRKVFLINAMIDLEDNLSLPVDRIHPLAE